MLDLTPPIWAVGALCRAIADALDARFNPVAVRGEISGLSRASSGHCYFALKDATGQLRCALFKRAAGLLDFPLREGLLVEVRGRVAIYEPRGDLQLVVESMREAGAGALFEQFLRLKAQLEGEGLFSTSRKRALAPVPRGIGVVTSLGAAALRDVLTTLARRAPHVPVLVAPASVQGAGAPGELVRGLEALYALAEAAPAHVRLDTILLVRGGGSIEDLWSFNDAALARTIARSPVPVVCGVGHETDVTIADFVADVRAPTPTAAAELAAMPREALLAVVERAEARLRDALRRRLDTEQQRLDHAVLRLGRPMVRLHAHAAELARWQQRIAHVVRASLRERHLGVVELQASIPRRVRHGLERCEARLARAALRLELRDPTVVLRRGYAWLSNEAGQAIVHPAQVAEGERVQAHLAEGVLALRVEVGPRA